MTTSTGNPLADGQTLGHGADTTTNKYGQQTDSKGHVLKESEIVREAIVEILEPYFPEFKPENLYTALTTYVMEQKNTEFYRGAKTRVLNREQIDAAVQMELVKLSRKGLIQEEKP